MKIFKFRAVDINTGEFVYAELGQISDEIKPGYLTFLVDGLPTVNSDSVAQLIGYDHDGNEVYEGDQLVGSDGTKWTAYLEFIGLTDEGFLHDVDLENLTLIKEDAQ